MPPSRRASACRSAWSNSASVSATPPRTCSTPTAPTGSDLETLKAFAVTTDHARQRAVWEQVSNQGYRPAAWQVKRLLTEERIPATAAIARFVGVHVYEAAGGAVLRDLFARDDEAGTWFEDSVLLEKLATAKLQGFADELATRWKWAMAMTEVDWTATARYGRIEPQPAARTAEEQAEIERLESRQSELAGLDDDAWTEQQVEEAEGIEIRLDEIEAGIEARATWRRDDFRIAGCIATIARDGTLQVIHGLVRPEDMPKPTETAGDAGHEDGSGKGNGHDGSGAAGFGPVVAPQIAAPMALPPDREAEARKEAGVGVGLADDLRSIRTPLVKAHLAQDFAAAFDLLLYQLGRAVFADGYRADALDIVIRETAEPAHDAHERRGLRRLEPGRGDAGGPLRPVLRLAGDRGRRRVLRRPARAAGSRQAGAVRGRGCPDAQRRQLAFEPRACPEFEATVARLGIDFARHVRPTADMLWSRINKSRILEIARATFGPVWASAQSKSKKPALAKAMERAFAAGDPPVGLDAAAHAAALAWIPPGFAAFDRGRMDEESDDAGAAEPAPAADASGPDAESDAASAAEAANADMAADPPCTVAAAGSIDPPAAPETDPAPIDHGNVDDGNDAGGDGPEARTAEPAPAADIAMPPPGPANGHDIAGASLEIPEFLRRAH